MSYQTEYTIEFENKGSLFVNEQIETSLIELLKNKGCIPDVFQADLSSNGECSWDNIESDMKDISILIPDVLFTIFGEGEDCLHYWCDYYFNGHVQTSSGVVTYDACTLTEASADLSYEETVGLQFEKVIQKGQRTYALLGMDVLNTDHFSYDYYDRYPHIKSYSMEESTDFGNSRNIVYMKLFIKNGTSYDLRRGTNIYVEHWPQFVAHLKEAKIHYSQELTQIEAMEKEWNGKGEV